MHKYFTKLAKQQVKQEVKVRYFGFVGFDKAHGLTYLQDCGKIYALSAFGGEEKGSAI